MGTSWLQVADVLDVIAEASIGTPLRLPSRKTSPEILKTLRWIQNTLDDDDGSTQYIGEHRVSTLPDIDGCQVTFTHASGSSPIIDVDVRSHFREQVNLGDLDPTSIEVNDAPNDVIGPVSIVTVHTTDQSPAVRLMANDRNGSHR